MVLSQSTGAGLCLSHVRDAQWNWQGSFCKEIQPWAFSVAVNGFTSSRGKATPPWALTLTTQCPLSYTFWIRPHLG